MLRLRLLRLLGPRYGLGGLAGIYIQRGGPGPGPWRRRWNRRRRGGVGGQSPPLRPWEPPDPNMAIYGLYSPFIPRSPQAGHLTCLWQVEAKAWPSFGFRLADGEPVLERWPRPWPSLGLRGGRLGSPTQFSQNIYTWVWPSAVRSHAFESGSRRGYAFPPLPSLKVSSWGKEGQALLDCDALEASGELVCCSYNGLVLLWKGGRARQRAPPTTSKRLKIALK